MFRNLATIYFLVFSSLNLSSARVCIKYPLLHSRNYAKDANSTSACQVLCEGSLLHTVQMSHIFDDSKTFVDMKLKFSPQQTIDDFQKFMTSKQDHPTKDEIHQFVEEHFDKLGTEFSTWIPSDWKEEPAFLELIDDPELRQWGSDLNAIWKDLGRKMMPDVFKNPELYTIIPIPNPVIVPGGRFREFYYWDSFWIIRGLLLSELQSTARGMIENFLSIVERYGFIPNGGRTYYTDRSQPPLLAGMVQSYVDSTNDNDFGQSALPMLEHEFEYWMNNRAVQVNGHNLYIYGVDPNSSGPRPESYREDVEVAEFFQSDDDKESFYADVKAAAESGMDFTSRWFINKAGGTEGNLTNIKTRNVVPVELNAILFSNAKIIAGLYAKCNNALKAVEYELKAAQIQEAIEAVLWSEEVGAWLDYDLINNRQRNFFGPTNLAPLWTRAYRASLSEHISKKILNYIESLGLDKYPGGIPNTLYRTGEQWDYPNAWPPMQYMIIEGLEGLGTDQAKQLSTRWAERWIKSNFQAYRETQAMFEKYDGETFGGYGGGGEYVIQRGFGWTNGIIIELLSKYGQQLRLADPQIASADS